MNLLPVIIFAISVQGVFLSYLLVNSKGQNMQHRLLALLVFSMSVAILGPALGLSGYYKELPHFIRIGDPLAFLFGPFLFFYIHYLTKGKLPDKYLGHLLPFTVYLIYLVPFYSLSGIEKVAFTEKVFNNGKGGTEVVAIQLLRTLHVSAYIILCLQLVKHFQEKIKENFSNIEKITLDKVLRLLKLFVTIAFAGITTFLFSLVIPINIVVINGVISLAVGVVIYGVTYATWSTAAMEANIKEPERAQIVISADVATEIWQVPDEIKETVPPAEETAEEVAAQSSRSIHHIKNEEYAILVDKLEGLLDKGIYINSDLTLSQLSEKLGIPSYQTSELINRYYRGSFFDFINSSRIEEVKKRLTDPSLLHFSILGIAMDCGFNSKSSFNTAFKKYTGMTPSEYRKKNIGSKVRLSKS